MRFMTIVCGKPGADVDDFQKDDRLCYDTKFGEKEGKTKAISVKRVTRVGLSWLVPDPLQTHMAG